MNDQSPGQPAVDADAPVRVDAPGPALARLRQARDLSIAEVAERLKYSARQIEALEADDYARLPGATFVRGMIRGYAKLLETDSEPLVKELERRHIPAQASVNLRVQRIPFPDRNKSATRVYAGLAMLTLVAAGAVLYEWRYGATTPALHPVAITKPAPLAAGQEVVSAPPQPGMPEIAPVAPGPEPSMRTSNSADAGRLLLEFRKESWVEIKDRGGQTLLSQLNAGGSRVTVEGLRPFTIVIGNAANVRLTYNDAPVDLQPHVKIEVARLTLE